MKRKANTHSVSRHPGLSALAVAIILGGALAATPLIFHPTPAHAEDGGGGHGGSGGSGGGHGGGAGAGGSAGGHGGSAGAESGGHDSGHDSATAEEGHGGKGPQAGGGKGQHGPSADSEGRGPRAGQTGSTRTGRPVWAKEGIPEVEIGRLNVSRAPAHVLDRAHAEALASMTPEMAAFYNQPLSQIVAALKDNFDAQTYIDSPLQNLSLLKDALNGTVALPGVTNDRETLMAVFLGVASDKTVPVTSDTVVAVTTILGTPVTGTAADKLATDAESVRDAIAIGHN